MGESFSNSVAIMSCLYRNTQNSVCWRAKLKLGRPQTNGFTGSMKKIRNFWFFKPFNDGFLLYFKHFWVKDQTWGFKLNLMPMKPKYILAKTKIFWVGHKLTDSLVLCTFFIRYSWILYRPILYYFNIAILHSLIYFYIISSLWSKFL